MTGDKTAYPSLGVAKALSGAGARVKHLQMIIAVEGSLQILCKFTGVTIS